MIKAGVKPNRERGFAAIFIAFTLVVVLSLLTVGFAQLMRREQRSALDRKLSYSASLAAESGINDASKALSEGYYKPKTQCTGGVDSTVSGSQYLKNPSVDRTAGTVNTCLLINPFPPTLEYSSVDEGEPTVAVIEGSTKDGADVNIGSLQISWQDYQDGTRFATWSRFQLREKSSWAADTGVLRFSLTPLYDDITRASLTQSTYTAYLYPTAGNSTPPTNSYSAGIGTAGGAILEGNCRVNNPAPRYCSVVVSVKSLNGNTGHNRFLLRMSSIYRNNKVTIQPFDISTPAKAIRIKGAQTLVDSTGRAQDVLRRLQVRIPASDSYDLPNFVLETTDSICKQIEAWPTNKAVNNIDASKGQGNAQNACNSSTF